MYGIGGIRTIALSLLAAPVTLGLGPHARTDRLHMEAKVLLERSVSDNLVLAKDGRSVELSRGALYEDDGPAAGFSFKPNVERLAEGVRIRKDLVIPDPNARRATLLVGPGGDLTASVNGKSWALGTGRKEGAYWRAYEIDPALLRAGPNSFVLSGRGQVWIARDDEYAAGSRTRTRHPNRSARSTDGGKTWDDRRLGSGGDVDGEYYVRIFLDQHRAVGTLLLPVLDVGNLAGHAVSAPLRDVGPVSLKLDGDAEGPCRMVAKIRSGTTFVPDSKNWSEWTALGPRGGTLENPAGRFIQVRLELSTRNGLKTPRLRSLTVMAQPRRGKDWTKKLEVVEAHNEEIIRTSIPFEYEPFDHPRLRKLREKYRLDEVVKGARNELEMLTRLANWANTWAGAGYKNKVGHSRPDPGYPPWDALEILKPMGAGKVWGGFCQQYNVCMIQACESLGLTARAISIGPGNYANRLDYRGGHEALEIWSDEYKKWIWVDGSINCYAVDEETGVPVSFWELRRWQLRTFKIVDGPARRIRPEVIADNGFGPGAARLDRVNCAEIRLIPRNNFLQRPSPVPLNQGKRGWFWTGHVVWTDDEAPARPLYGRRVEKRGNWEWTLNQAHYVLEATGEPDVFRVHLDTVTPGFDTFLAGVDGGEKKPVPAVFRWKLHPGTNRLEVCPRNKAGREGISSWIVLNR